eukprot:4528656-Ditylum_brightwellii.AAC.1
MSSMSSSCLYKRLPISSSCNKAACSLPRKMKEQSIRQFLKRKGANLGSSSRLDLKMSREGSSILKCTQSHDHNHCKCHLCYNHHNNNRFNIV